MKNRSKAQAFIIDQIEAMMPGSDNTKIYQDFFGQMSDEEFDAFMKDIDSGIKKLAIIAPNFGKQRLSVERNLSIAKKLGHNFFERIWIEGTGDVPTYLTPIPYMVVDIPLRRQAQLLIKKISIPDDNKTIDNMTGQPTGASKGSKISYPELQVLAAMKLDNCTIEMLKYRGGDMGGFVAMNKMISRNGGVSLKAIEQYATGVESTRTLKTFLNSMHLENTL